MNEQRRPAKSAAATATSTADGSQRGGRPTAAERLSNPAAFLSRGDLRALGLERRAIDSVFRSLPTVVLPGYSRPLVQVGDYLALIESATYRGDRVRKGGLPIGPTA